MNREHFIENIEIKNFKCFKNFRAEGFGRVNLIGGKNNVGKTAFMEALSTNVYSNNLGYFVLAIVQFRNRRNILNHLEEYMNNSQMTFRERFIKNPLNNIKRLDIKTNIREVAFSPKNNNGILKYFFKINKDEYEFNIDDIPIIKAHRNIIFIGRDAFSNKKIISYFASIQKIDNEDFLNKSLQIIDKNITKFKILEEIPYCKVGSEYLELIELGDGIKQFISIIIALYQAKNGYLFIDEVGNGIHYTNLDKLWEIILTISKEQNVQLFATTHSKECIESYARVAKKLEDEDIAFIDLGRNKKNEIKAIVMDSERFYRELKMGNEVRGW